MQTVIPKRNLKQINEALYALAQAEGLVKVLENAGEDTSEYVAAIQHLKRNLKAYKAHIQGTEEVEE